METNPESSAAAGLLSSRGKSCKISALQTASRGITVREQLSKKDEYQKALTTFGLAVKEFHKGELEKAAESFRDFIEKFPAEREIVDRAKAYLAIALKRPKKEAAPPKTFADHCSAGVARINQRDLPGAAKVLEKALEFKENEGLVYYLLADVQALTGEAEASLDLLKKAVQKDKSFAVLAQNERDFEPLWEDKKFKLITKLA
jgi:tetratricopeptide (TPR) repeat protein